MTTFKIGDEVIVTSGHYGITKEGSIGKILSINGDYQVTIAFTKLTGNRVWAYDNANYTYTIHLKDITLYTPKDNKTLVCEKIKYLDKKFKERKIAVPF